MLFGKDDHKQGVEGLFGLFLSLELLLLVFIHKNNIKRIIIIISLKYFSLERKKKTLVQLKTLKKKKIVYGDIRVLFLLLNIQ